MKHYRLFYFITKLPYNIKNYFFKIICIFNDKINIYYFYKIIMNLYETVYKFKNIVIKYQNISI